MVYEPLDEPGLHGWLERPSTPTGVAVLAHGAGSDARAPLLTRVAGALAGAGLLVLRCDLPYRQRRATGPPRPHEAAEDRAGLRRAIEKMRGMAAGPVLLGGHSYGGRQASMLAAEEPGICDALLLLAYPLHPPGQPERLRTAHFSNLRIPALFVHGTRDRFGSLAELRAAIPGHAELLAVEGAGHDLKRLDTQQAASRVLALLSGRDAAGKVSSAIDGVPDVR
jgi:predicted alpha/beta-hydrolase family hydrolase